ncbi:MAG: hypothetical protein LBJ00_05455 [Planctomycetaceae bacterium]|jgi:hypothetical protein|nr:hypothetical protein [Planctomycetaceae bacterium]
MKKINTCSSCFKIPKAEHASVASRSGCSRAKPIAHTGIGIFILLLVSCVVPQFLSAAQYARPTANQVPFVQNSAHTSTRYNAAYQNTLPQTAPNRYAAKSTPQNQQKNNSTTIIRQLPQPAPKTKSKPQKNTAIHNVQFSGELFDMRILDSDEETLVVPKQVRAVAPNRNNSGESFIVSNETKPPLKLITPVDPHHVPSAGFLRYSEDYPDPRSIGAVPYVRGGIAPIPYNIDRHAAVPEEEVHHRYHVDEARKQFGQPPVTAAECPLCKDDPKTPCGRCSKCKQGYPCERTVCRHCVQPVSRDLNNFCDLTVNGEPCGTCDSCREHRSDPCEHGDDGRGPHGEWNPYKQSRIFAVIARPILDEWNNGARKFPVYYNPAPYYRPYWNPSLYTGYARPYTFRYTCPVCSDGVCKCDKPPFAGQVPFAYACKFCNRNPCACAEDICDANAEMEPTGRSNALGVARSKSTRIQDAEERGQEYNNQQKQPDSPTTPDQNPNPPDPTAENDRSVLDLFNEKTPNTRPNNNGNNTPRPTGQRQTLDAPKSQTPGVIPNTGVLN